MAMTSAEKAEAGSHEASRSGEKAVTEIDPIDLGEQLAKLPEAERRQVLEATQKPAKLTRVQSTSVASFSGPLPPPQHLAEYEEIVPGAGKRILRMAEREQDIRANSLDGLNRNERRRVYGAVALGLGVLAISAYATFLGEPIIAVPLGLAGVISLLLKLLTRERREGR